MMNEVQTRKVEMLSRVRDFGESHAESFASAAHAADLFAKIAAAVERLSDHAAAQATGSGTWRQGAANRRLTRQSLRRDLEAISRTASAVSEKVPGLVEKFRMPASQRDQALLDAARSFDAEAVPYRAEFALFELDDAFFARLSADIEAFEASLATQWRGRETRITATVALGETIAEGLRILKKLDTIVRNKFAGDPVTLSAWIGASRVQRTGRTRAPKPQETRQPSAS